MKPRRRLKAKQANAGGRRRLPRGSPLKAEIATCDPNYSPIGRIKPALSILTFLDRPDLFGGLFKDPTTWRPWFAFLRAVYGLPMDKTDLKLFRQHTGRKRPRQDGYPEAVAVVGCQSGKSQIATLIGVFEAAITKGRDLYVPLIAQDSRGAQRTLFGYAERAIDASPVLRREVTRQTRTEIELANGSVLAVYPCRPAAVRGIRAACAVIDELAFFLATDGRPTDTEMLRAVRTRLATTGGKLLILSSPYGQSGALYNLHRKYYGREGSSTLVWQASAPQMNPTLSKDYLARMKRDDPEAYRSEVLGEFRKGIATFLDPDALNAVVASGVREQAPQADTSYIAFADAASGSGKDAFALGIAHKDGERAVLDLIRAWSPPFNPSGVIAEAADLLKRYDLTNVTGDKYAPGFVHEGFASHAVNYITASRTTSEMYLEFLPLVNSAGVLLLDKPALLHELRGLERRRGTAGRDRIDHRPGAHDDRAVAAAGALVQAARGRPMTVDDWLISFSGAWDGKTYDNVDRNLDYAQSEEVWS